MEEMKAQSEDSPTQDKEHNETQSQVSPPAEGAHSKETSPEETRQELHEAIKGSNEVLATATTVLTLFPDTVTIDRAKLTVFKRAFMNAGDVISVRVEDVLNVEASVGPLFGTLKIFTRIIGSEKPYVISRLKRKDALRLKRIAQGYVIALQREIDCSQLPTKELTVLLEQLGEDDHGTPG